MKRNRLKIILWGLAMAIITSCVTHKKVTYLQYKGKSEEIITAPTPSAYKIQPHDNLYIRVVTPDPQWSTMFNTIGSSAYSYNVSEQGADLVSYTVNDEGNIKLPYAGKLMVAGKTLAIINEEVEKILAAYVKDPSVTVKLVNNYVSLLGEVQNPGRYLIYKERMNIFQALSMAGDLSEYSNRQKVQIVRQTPDGIMIKDFSLKDRSIITSEFFYIKPNDAIYVEPMRGKFFKMNSFPYSVILSSITTFLLVMNYLK